MNDLAGNAPRLLFVFVDGIGLGEADPDANPFAAAATPFLTGLLGGPLTSERTPVAGGEGEDAWLFRSVDATLGWRGLPQSATGQTALLTGRNGADLMEGHYGPWPGPTLRRALERGTLFHEHAPARLANAYPPGFFRALEGRRIRLNAPVFAARAAGLELPDVDAYRRGEAIAADLTGAHFAAGDPDLPLRTPRESGAQLARLAATARFTFFDLWLTDRVGHRGGLGEATGLVETLDAFLAGVWSAAGDATVLLVSDHGNLEDARVGTHTRNPVPLLARGPRAHAFGEVADLLGVADAVRAALARP